MNLKKHIIDTIKEWQLKIGYLEGNMKLYYPGESLAMMLGVCREELLNALSEFCEEVEPVLGRIRISGSYERFCLDIPQRGCAYVAEKVEEPRFLKLFLSKVTTYGNTMEQIRGCFADYATENGTTYVEEDMEEKDIEEKDIEEKHGIDGEEEGAKHAHTGHAFYFMDENVEEYVYWVEENGFGLTYHRFTHAEYENLK